MKRAFLSMKTQNEKQTMLFHHVSIKGVDTLFHTILSYQGHYVFKDLQDIS